MSKPAGKLAMAYRTIANMENKIANLVAGNEAAQELISIIGAERDELKSQLVEVQNNCTGISPCDKFCEALATKKMFDNLRTERDALAARVNALSAAAEQLLNIDDCEDEEDAATIHSNMNDVLLKTPAQCLAERDKAAFIAGYELCQSTQPVPAMRHHNLHGFAEQYANRIQQQCLVCGGYHGNNMQCHNLIPHSCGG